METVERKSLEISTDGRILIITISNPPHNYLHAGFFGELHSCQELMLSPDIDAIIFTGKGNVFSKGADIEEIRSRSHALDLKTLLYGNEIFTSISRLTKPVIAAINGACMGGGLELALSCHIRVCSEKARLGLPEVSIGLIPGLGGIQRMARVVGESKALEMILLGDIISAERALGMNLVSRVFPQKEFLSNTLLFVKTLLLTRREALEEVLKLVALSRTQDEDRSISRAAESFIRLIS
jgi:enoyl-CoA hydratase/carnithine racemase